VRANVSRRAARRGFTLVEMLVALAIAATVLVTARALLEQLADDAEKLVTHATESDSRANAERTLRELALRLEVGTDDTRRFAGDERVTRFTSWCEVPRGWQERCRVTLALDVEAHEPVLAAALSTGEILVLRRGFTNGSLRYLGDAARGGTWFRSWGESITAPLAIGVVLDADTLILRIGERG
jgi:prepilin-type N-terminal cleavage/methylation domain-containing protein